jgi:hypothetical protein
MTLTTFVRAEVSAMCGGRRNLSPAHREILFLLLRTPALRRRFAPLRDHEVRAIVEEWLAESVPLRRRRSPATA